MSKAAQGGHNSSLVFLDNMLQMGNETMLGRCWASFRRDSVQLGWVNKAVARPQTEN